MEAIRNYEMGAKTRNIVGQVFGKLTAVSFAYSENGNAHWNCVCSCGNERIYRSNALLRGQIQSCSKECQARGKVEANIGKVINGVTIVSIDEERTASGAQYYLKCKCECGREFTRKSHLVLNGAMNHCGVKCPCLDTTNSNIGKIFGKLTVISAFRSPDVNENRLTFKCRCVCGNEKVGRAKDFEVGNLLNCGAAACKGQGA